MTRTRRLLIIGGESHYGRGVCKGIHEYCRAHGRWDYHLQGDNSPEAVKQTLVMLTQWNPDGIIAQINSHRVLRLVRDSRLPSVNFSAIMRADLPSVVPDATGIGQLAARHFLNNGFRSFGFMIRGRNLRMQRNRDGFADELARAGFSCDTFVEPYRGARTRSDWFWKNRRADRWLTSLKKPAAILANNDAHGYQITMACRRLGLRIPDDVAVVGVGNQEVLCQMANPPLSSVEVDKQRIGYEAARLMDQLLHGAAVPIKRLLIPPRHLVVRQSSDMIAVEDAEVAAALRFIREHAGEPMSVKDLLREVPISRVTLERRFDENLGRTPAAEIARVRLERAKTLLEESDLTVSAVSSRCGFSSQEIFMVFFRRQLGLTPTEYRRKCRTGVDPAK